MATPPVGPMLAIELESDLVDYLAICAEELQTTPEIIALSILTMEYQAQQAS